MLSPEDVIILDAAITILKEQQAEINKLHESMSKKNKGMISLLTTIMQQNCSHKNADGTSAIKKSMLFDTCSICGKEW